MKLEILLSCMHQSNLNIVKQSQIKSDVLIVNQCDKNDYEEQKWDSQRIKLFSTRLRGLSCSRNIAIKNATGDICLICDDDERFLPNYEAKILKSFKNIPDADVIVFQFNRIGGINKKYPIKIKKLNFWNCLKVSSIEIAFKRKSIVDNNILFDETIGSGVSKAGGEENVFLHNCLRNNLKIYFVPETIVELKPSESQWTESKFSEEYFIDRGKFTKKLILGKLFATIYALYFSIFKWKEYKHRTNFYKALKSMFYGIYS